MDQFILISGCSGGGKSTLLEALGRQGFATVAEPGRRVVETEEARGGNALPWLDMAAFLRRTLDLAIADFEAARSMPGPVFFDRGIIDAVSGLQHITGEEHDEPLRRYRYATTVFLAPPWPEIYQTDAARRHGLDDAIAEYERLAAVCPEYGYRTQLLPKAPLPERTDYLLSALSPH